MDKSMANKIATEAFDLLNEHFKNQKIKVTRKGGTYDSTSFKIAFTFNEIQEDGKIITKEEKDYNLCKWKYNLGDVPLGAKFTGYNGDIMEVSGLMIKARKSPIIGKAKNGKLYRYEPHYILRSLVKD